MKKYSIIAVASLITIAGFTFGYLQRQNIPDYKPRESNLESAEAENEEKEAKGMYEFMHKMRVNPNTGTISMEDIKLANAGLRNMSNLRGKYPMNWEELGPDNVGGRTRAVLVDNQDKTGNTIYAGGVSGGLWRSTNAGSFWYKVNDLQENMSITAIGQTPNGNIYIGTGEGGFYFANGQGQGGGFLGGGAYKSDDGGKTFKILSSTVPTGAGGNKWLTVQSMAGHPTKNRIFTCLTSGFYMSDDDGATWKKPSGAGASGNGLMQEVKVDKNGVVYLSNASNIWKSEDGGDNFVSITPTAANTAGGIVTGGTSRISIAVGHSNPDYVYCMMADRFKALGGIFQSKDRGVTWNRIASKAQNGVDFDPLSSPGSSQGEYDNVIAVDPTNESRIFAAGVELWEWLDPNVFPNNPKAGWRNTTSSNSGFSNKFSPTYLHADVHQIVFDVNHGSPYTTYFGSDGGISKSSDGCNTFQFVSRGFNITQFYGMAVNTLSKDRSWDKKYLAGSQDNSCVLITGRGNTPQTSTTISGGDGFQCEASQIYPEILFYGSQNGGYLRSGNGGLDAQRMYDCRTIWQMDVTYGYGSANKCEAKTSGFIDYFNVPLRLKENWSDTTSLMTLCANRQSKTGGAIFITRDAIDLKKQSGMMWYKLYESNGYFHKLEISNDLKTIYAATGGVLMRFRGFDTITFPEDTKDSSWTIPRNRPGAVQDTVLASFGNRFITGIAEDKNDPLHLVVSLGNYGFTDHVYESFDGGVTFSNISGNTMLTFPVYDVIISNDNPKVILVATEFGIFGTENGGATWTEQNNGMARVPVFQIRQYEDKPWEGPTVYLATHGRGMFKSTTLRTGVESSGTKKLGGKLAVYPNPTSDLITIDYEAKQSGTSYLTVIDIKGNLIYNADHRVVTPGDQRITLNTSQWASGNYLLYIRNGANEAYQKLSVIR